ncbi:hypothetical protein [Prochlorococcus marinus]|uniref:hypothetical protein n=1 Tax=Prochlorococcus marinus TaxID=1219 RepID=UPI0039AF7238
MRNSLTTKLIGFLLLYPLLINSALSKNINNQLLSNQLEEILNERNDDLLKDLFSKKSFNKFNKQSLAFRNKYKDSKWSIKMIRNDPSKSLLDIKIKSTRTIGEKIYNLHTIQTVKIETHKNKIKSYQVIDEESILNSQNSPLIVKIISPDKVLTGERYEINLIIEAPLDNSLTASGMIVLKNNEKMNISNDFFGIKPNQSGGLFKYIQAPLEPSTQTLSAIITHPEGIYSITKKIKVGL